MGCGGDVEQEPLLRESQSPRSRPLPPLLGLVQRLLGLAPPGPRHSHRPDLAGQSVLEVKVLQVALRPMSY